MESRQVARLEAYERHALHTERSDDKLACLIVGYGQSIVADQLANDQLRVMVSAAAAGTFGEGGGHLRGSVGGKEFDVPPSADTLAEQVEREVLFAEVFANADGAAHAAGAVIDAVRLGIVDDAGNEGGHDDNRVRLYTPDGIPLELGDAVTHAHDARAQATDAEKVGQPGHEALVDRRHQLEDAARARTGAREGDLLVVSQPIQIGVGHGKRHRVA